MTRRNSRRPAAKAIPAQPSAHAAPAAAPGTLEETLAALADPPVTETTLQPDPLPAAETADAAQPPVAGEEPFAVKGDHDGDGKIGGAHPPVVHLPAAAPAPAAAPREKTLHELNLEARATDREHARIREEAEKAAREHVDPILAGVPRRRSRNRRYQKPLRPLVTE